ncbi:MAG TPA: hypothetical protein ENH31_00450 [Nitrospirae bacterium]|nr:hypothetical protein [Nitrospirota bacterium]HDK41415.1 hypothetical protein [Nitrospirota bacterium]HDK81022.1 hypothetical protein [Nitrospirota bacterium]
MDKEILNELTIEDMPNQDMRLVAEACGIEIAVKLLQELGGIGINIPKFGFKKLVQQYVCDHYDGSNAKELALKLGITERHIYNLCQPEQEDNKQMDLLEK